MDHPKYHQFREDFLNAPGWHYISSSDETDDEDEPDGLLTPVSMTRHDNINAPSAHLIHESISKRIDRKSSASSTRQRRPYSSSSRRPITRSCGTIYLSLDYRRKGFIIYRPATKNNISMTFQDYLKHYDIERMYRPLRLNRKSILLLGRGPTPTTIPVREFVKRGAGVPITSMIPVFELHCSTFFGSVEREACSEGWNLFKDYIQTTLEKLSYAEIGRWLRNERLYETRSVLI